MLDYCHVFNLTTCGDEDYSAMFETETENVKTSSTVDVVCADGTMMACQKGEICLSKVAGIGLEVLLRIQEAHLSSHFYQLFIQYRT